MERFYPSQIDWTGFMNREPTSITQLWPPSNSTGSRETTPDRSTLPTSTNTAMSDWQTVTDPSDLSLTSPDHHPDHVRSIESLRSFIKKEIGLNAIDNRMSQPVFKETTLSSRATINPEQIDLEIWTAQQVRRMNQTNHDVDTQQQYEGRADDQPIDIQPATRSSRMARLKEKFLNQRDNLKEVAKAAVSKIQKCFSKLSSRI